MNKTNHWQRKKDSDQIIWLGLNRYDESVNSINNDVLDELNILLQDIAQDEEASGLIVYSAKPKGFIAGADVKEFAQFEETSQAIDFLRKGQVVFSRLAALKIPTVAMIHGFCMGGGMELALACDYRIATDDDDTRIGLPEVKLGIHPGWGGTVRLPKLIGGFNALSQVILPGASLRASKAKKLGIVDDVVPLRQLERASVYFIHHKPPLHKPSYMQSMSNYSWSRKLLAKLFQNQLSKKIRQDHYPAPYAVVDLWEKEGSYGERAYLKEVDSIEQLITENDTAANLIRLFLLREKIKSFGKESDFKAKHIHVIGAGVMGGDIAAWCAYKGIYVTLEDKSYEQIAPSIGRAHQLFKKRLKKTRLIQAAMDRIIPDPEGWGVKRADVIIEAIYENLEAKQSLIKSVEERAKSDAIIATNTSSIPLDEISNAMNMPERLVGIHFFNPVAKMELIEIVSSAQTSENVKNNACSFVNQISRLPLPVKSSPGFLVNRVLMPYLMEAVELLEEGYQGEMIDKAAMDFGMFMGPIELADTVGMDVCLAVAENLTQHLGGHVPEKIRLMVEKGKLGRKVGEGFYKWKNGKPVKNKINQASKKTEIADRLILRMVNEAAACLREGVVANSDLLDAAMVFGTGFAPFRGGPMNYAKQFGQDKLNQMFVKLEQEYGDRFKADSSLGS